MQLSHKMFMIACLTTAAFIGPAYAEDEVPPAVQAFLDNIERQTQIEPAYDSVEEDGDGNVTLTNLSLTKAAEGDQPGMTVKIAESKFSGITEEGESLYKVGNATFSNMTIDVTSKDGPFSMSMPEATAEGWYIRELGDNPTPQETILASSTFAKKMTGGKMTISAMGQTVTADGLETTWDGDAATGSGKYTMKLSNIAIPESVLAMADQGGMLKQLGYTSLSFDLSGNGEVTMKGDTVDYDVNFGIAGHDIAALNFGIAAGDIPLAVYSELQKAQASGKEPDFNALMPQLQNIAIKGARLRFEDASITKKLLPMLAALQGMDEKTMIASAGPMMQMGLMQLQNEAFAKQTVDAVNAFLAAPKSLTVTAKPAQPIKVSEFMTMNPSAPGEAITKLGVSVSSND